MVRLSCNLLTLTIFRFPDLMRFFKTREWWANPSATKTAKCLSIVWMFVVYEQLLGLNTFENVSRRARYLKQPLLRRSWLLASRTESIFTTAKTKATIRRPQHIARHLVVSLGEMIKTQLPNQIPVVHEKSCCMLTSIRCGGVHSKPRMAGFIWRVYELNRQS